VTRFRPGDEVFGIGKGAFAEYARAPENKLAPKPANLTVEQAAVVAVSGLPALQGLRDKGRVKPGQKVLIIGASGAWGPTRCSGPPQARQRRVPADVEDQVVALCPVREVVTRVVDDVLGTQGTNHVHLGLSRFVGQKLTTFVSKENHEDMLVLKELIEAGKITPVIDRTYPLAEVPMAIRYVEQGKARGKVVITV
jgi:NADPH:quinone reductase-like Zn-dependent oxidoreductase